MTQSKGITGIRGLLVDLDGVLYVGDQPVPGAREALSRLRDDGWPCRFITNTTTRTAAEVVAKLSRLGFAVEADEIFTPVVATKAFLRQQGEEHPNVHLLLRESVRRDFDEFPHDAEQPDFVIVGDIGAAWSYDLLNTAFRQLVAGAELIAMHKNKFFETENGLTLDIGAFVAGLEYVTGREARIIGKPSLDFFAMALRSMELPAEQIAVVGDDIDSDVGGGQAAGSKGILVKTGKYREEHARDSSVAPDLVLSSFADLPDALPARA